MHTETIIERNDILVRRQVIEAGETTPWHVDVCRRFSVVVRGERLAIEYRGGGERIEIEVRPGMAGWDEPEARVHRAVNTEATAYEEIAVFLLEAPGADPQPEVPG